LRNYDYTTIVDGVKITTNELKDHRRGKLLEALNYGSKEHIALRLKKYLEVDPHSLMRGLKV
tara:strand:+ start:616 stop:801 length:186 start_codon:yes stop_codon:yes gene_type:complete